MESPLSVMEMVLTDRGSVSGIVLDAGATRCNSAEPDCSPDIYLLFRDRISRWEEGQESPAVLHNLESLGRGQIVSRDPVGRLVLQPDGSLYFSNSDIGGTYCLYSPASQEWVKISDDEIISSWNEARAYPPGLLLGQRLSGRNLFAPSLTYLPAGVFPGETIEAPGQVYAASFWNGDTSSAYAVSGPSGKVYLSSAYDLSRVFTELPSGSAMALVDFNHDQKPLLVTSSTEPYGGPDKISVFDISGPANIMLWQSDTVYHSIKCMTVVHYNDHDELLIFALDDQSLSTNIYSLTTPEYLHQKPAPPLMQPGSTAEELIEEKLMPSPPVIMEQPPAQPPQAKKPGQKFIDRLREIFRKKP